MRKPSMLRIFRTARSLALVLFTTAVLPLQSCTDLTETPTSSITPGNFFQTEEEVLAGLAGVYSILRSSINNAYYFWLSEIPTDEIIIPTRGQDWYDNGTWLELHRQTWAASSPSEQWQINGAWVDGFTGIARANLLLQALTTTSIPDQKAIEAELRTLRAFYYYMLMDLFGGVPIVTTTEVKARPRNTRAEVFKFIEEELQAARLDLPDRWPATSNGRLPKGAADAILANMYLNAQVFTGTVSGGGLQRGTARWQDAVDVADRILNAGVYVLAADWRSNFTPNNESSPENILVVKMLAQEGLGLWITMYSLHYNQLSPSPANGPSTLAETYYAFDPDDLRRQIFLVGPQFNLETGEPAYDRSGQRLVFTPEIRDALQATEGEGARPNKWPPDPSHSGYDHGNDFAYFRLAEIYLIKAEALNELGRTGEAVQLLNTLRARVFDPPKPVTASGQTSVRELILRERLFELTFEAKRRQDLIRYGRFTLPWSTTMLNGKEQREPYRILMPIPQTQMDANPLLVQNPGY